MKTRSATSIVDARGYARVAYYDSAAGSDRTQVRERRCGPDAVAALGPLLEEIRQKLPLSEEDPWVTCKGPVCWVRGEGEWSHQQALYFRSTTGGPMLEAWTEVELAGIEPTTGKERVAWVNQGRWAMGAKRCDR